MRESKLTLSVVTASVGGFVGHVSNHPQVLDTAKERLDSARGKGVIKDFHVLRCGDDIGLVITHGCGCASPKVHGLVWNILGACDETAVHLKLHGAGRGLLKEGFKGNLAGAGPGVAEMEFEERKSEPVVVLMASRVSTGTWNLPLFKIFADPFNTPGLVLDPSMIEGFSFSVLDTREQTVITLSTPKDAYYLLALISATDRFIVTGVYRNSDARIAAAVSSWKRIVSGTDTAGRAEPSVIIRCHDGLPGVGEAMEPFAFPHLVCGHTGRSYCSPLMPVPFYEANPSRSAGPPRAIAAGFQVSDGRLIGPHDMFDDPGFDEARRIAGKVTDYLRRHGPFKPHRSGLPETEYAGAAQPLIDRIKERFKKIG